MESVVSPGPAAHQDEPTPDAAAATTPQGTAPRLGSRFHALLAATGAANLGDGVVQAAIPLVALGLTRSPSQIALLTAVAWLPWLLLGIGAGVLVDRVDRRRVQIGALVARGALLAVAAWLAVHGLTIAWLIALALAYGVTEVLADLAAGALVPDVVAPADLPAANGRIMAVQQVANAFLGGPLAGLLLTLGTAWALGAPAALAVLAAAVLWRGVPGVYRHAPVAPDAPHDPRPGAAAAVRRAGRDVREGLSLVLRHRVLRPVVLAAALLNMASTAYFTVFVLWAVGPGSRIGMTAGTYPLLLVALAVGAVAGSVLVARAARALGEVRLMVGAFTLAFALLVVPVVAPHPAAVAATLLLVGALSTTGNVVNETLRQRIVPAHLLGRVGGAGRTLSVGLMPVGALLAGGAAERWGLAATMLGATALAVAVALALAASLRGTTPADVATPDGRAA
ncbi:MFS transporter [Cellulomonas wangsupingiae]|uniref:MFS transporter n=1 Tax=Cellulomonas wangsupingiae TaxID=2968085 RepID=A0ABY5K640_9CELL|nr:MFS transporter [Cellulomonas wangsupingiae]MCC2336247.1 MFS transporter [Cellulomonas wangsupingiae]UUI64510.1 MFS transporter [Cellulomonas wangsupingiae]